MSALLETNQWKMGDAAQQAWAREMARQGRVVLPAYGMTEVDPRTKAPVLFTGDQLLVAPDLFVFGSGKHTWHEVKAKATPGWRRFPPGPRWEHGIDRCLFDEYQIVEEKTGDPVYLVIHERCSPIDPECDSPLQGPAAWLFISLADARQYGRHQITWPGGKKNPGDRGKRGMGGWLWPRTAMCPFTCAA